MRKLSPRLFALLALLLVIATACVGLMAWAGRVTAPDPLPVTHPAQHAVVLFETPNWIDGPRPLGCGVVYAPGRVLTAWHVLDNAESARVVFPDGSRRRIQGVLAGDEHADLLVVAVEPRDNDPTLPLTDFLPTPGAPATIVPSRMLFGVRDTSVAWAGVHPEFGLSVSLDTEAIPGMSGSPVLDPEGRVFGIVTRSGAGYTSASANHDLVDPFGDTKPAALAGWFAANRTGITAARDDAVAALEAASQDPAQALGHAHQALDAAPDSYFVRMVAAEVLISTGRLDRAEEIINLTRVQAFDVWTLRLEALLECARTGADDTEDVERLVEAAFVPATGEAAWYHLYWMAGRRDEAVSQCRVRQEHGGVESVALGRTIDAILTEDPSRVRDDRLRLTRAVRPEASAP